MEIPARIGAVIVTHEPEMAQLAQLIECIVPQVNHVVVVENASSRQADVLALCAHAGVECMAQPVNAGLADGLDRGITQAMTVGCEFVLLLDQDSLPAATMVEALLGALLAVPAAAAAGPVQIDARNGAHSAFIRHGFPFNQKLRPEPGNVVICDELITSGSLLRASALVTVGGMDAGLFIDYVDTEWCMRARAAGWQCLGVADAHMLHRYGERLHWRPGGHAAVHSPRRLYYMMRNRVLLYKRPSTPAVWILQDAPRALLKLLGFSIVVPPRMANVRAMLRGLTDGARGRTGPMPE